jgi:hypothetical protein
MPKKTVPVVVIPEQELAKFEPSYNRLTAEGKGLKIVDEATKLNALDIVRELENLQDKYKAFRDSLVSETIKKMQKLVQGREKVIKEIVGDWHSGLRGQLSQYETLQEQARIEQEARLREKQQKEYEKQIAKAEKKGTVPPPPPAPVAVVAQKDEGVSYSEKWVYEVVDFKALSDDCKMVDDKLVMNLINKCGVREKAGLKIWSVKTPIIKEVGLGDL